MINPRIWREGFVTAGPNPYPVWRFISRWSFAQGQFASWLAA